MSTPDLATCNQGRFWPVVFIGALAVFALLEFSRLGHYALWEDEAYTALCAKGVRQTGDIAVLLDGEKNLIPGMFENNGVSWVNKRERANAPLPAYLIAAGTALFGDNAFAARLFPALLGFAAFALVAWQTRRLRNPALVCAMLAFAFCCNASLLLFFRQARYFGPAVFFMTVITLVYLRPRISWRQGMVFTLATVCLYLTQYMLFFCVFVALGVDYFIFKRRIDGFPIKRALALLAPAAIICFIFLLLLAPYRTSWAKSGLGPSEDGIREKLMLWWWQWRDMNTCEFTSLAILALVLGCAIRFKDRWLWRGLAFMFVYVTVLTVVTAQVVKNNTVVADVRYLVPLLPLLAVTSVRAILLATGGRPVLTLAIGALAFTTSLPTFNWIKGWDFRPVIAKYIGELAWPNPEPFTPTAGWLKKNVPENATVWVMPTHYVAPLLFLDSRPVYAWNLPYPPPKQFEGWPPAFFRGLVPPDFIICFGPSVQQVAAALTKANRPDLQYKHVATLDCFGTPYYRPELFWRSFDPILNHDVNIHGVHIFQHVPRKQ